MRQWLCINAISAQISKTLLLILLDKMKKYLFIVLLFFCFNSFGQISVLKVDPLKLPKELKYSGKIKNCVKWSDNLGVNYLITTETGAYSLRNQEDEDFRNADLYAYHYVTNGDNLKLLWTIHDFTEDCSVDLYVRFISKAFNITDLDKNGVAEVWVMYENQCTSDVSPGPTKIIMYENTKKYALRGFSKVKVSQSKYEGGNYTLDDSFKTGNSLFKQFAINLWEKNKMKEW